jgi:L-cysteine desulfidase
MSATETLASDMIQAPRAAQCANLAVTTTAIAVDLRLVGNQTPNMAAATGKVGTQQRFVTIYADGADLGVIFGPTSASVSGANVPALATVGTNVAGVCARIPVGQERSYYVMAGTDVWVGVVGSAAGSVRITPSSP